MKNVILPVLLATTAFAAVNRDGIMGVNKTFSAQTLQQGKLTFGANTQIIDDQNILQDGSIVDEDGTHFLTDFLLLNSSIFLGVGLGPYVDVGFALPFYYEKFNSDVSNLQSEQQTYGDLRYRLKIQFPFKEKQVLDVALLLGGTAPTQFDERGVIPRELELFTNDVGDFDQGSSPFGAGLPTFLAGLGLTFDLGQVAEKFQFLWHFNLGVRKINLSSQPPFDDILFWSTAAEYQASSFIRFFAEVYHESRFDHLGDNEFSTEPTTVTFGGVAQTPVGLDFQVGLIAGLNSGSYIPVQYLSEKDTRSINSFGIQSTADYSMMFQVSWSGFVVQQDVDGDGIKNKVDKCPFQAEDKDNFEDEDGCPDNDNDKDGIADVKDKCPGEPEDKDGFKDNDGCPEADNDNDGIPDAKDRCPTEAQGADGKEGCPNLDKDNDGVLDALDKCPNEAEDKDVFQDEDGCPEADNDNDGIPDLSDKCANAAETVNKFEDEDGCPDKVSEIVKTLVLKGVNFKTNSAELTIESYSVLDGIVPQLVAYPEMEFEVSGHTDNRGSATKNQALSQARAQSVANYFIQKGVDSKRLRVMGYGFSRPMVPNSSAENRALNRRVELNRTK